MILHNTIYRIYKITYDLYLNIWELVVKAEDRCSIKTIQGPNTRYLGPTHPMGLVPDKDGPKQRWPARS